MINYNSPPSRHLALAPNASACTLRFKDGMQVTFDAHSLLVSQTDLNGNTVTINRDASGNITTVADASGRTALTFTYTSPARSRKSPISPAAA